MGFFSLTGFSMAPSFWLAVASLYTTASTPLPTVATPSESSAAGLAETVRLVWLLKIFGQ